MEQWIKLCKAAGLNVRSMMPDECYVLAGKILDDHFLDQKAKAYMHLVPAVTVEEKMNQYSRAFDLAMAGMTPAELVALRERVTGVRAISSARA
jgi:hypothetical protein